MKNQCQNREKNACNQSLRQKKRYKHIRIQYLRACNHSDQLQVIKRRIQVGSPTNALKTLIEEEKKRPERGEEFETPLKSRGGAAFFFTPAAHRKRERERETRGLYKLPFSRSTRHKFPARQILFGNHFETRGQSSPSRELLSFSTHSCRRVLLSLSLFFLSSLIPQS